MSTLDLVTRLGSQSGRAGAAAALAEALGAEGMLLLVRDPATGTLLPAPGMPQTVRGGSSWRTFVAQLPARGRSAATVELPRGTQREVVALTFDGTACILVGGLPVEPDLNELERLLPLLAGLLAAEQDAVLARAEALAANEHAGRAEVLAHALDAARAEASALNAELRDEHRRKDEFLAMLGHELRNPLAPLVTSLELMRVRGRYDAAPKELIDVMTRQTAQLTRLVDDLLDVARVSRGRIELRNEPLLIREVMAGAIEESRTAIEAQRHELRVLESDEPLTVSGDRARLVQVFGNLLNNAAKYTDPGGIITVTIARQQQNALVTVRDTGIGIPPEAQPHIFDLFAQAPAALGRARGGLGIGLTLVRTLVQLHGGRISVESAGVGQGSTFSVTLPLALAGHAQAAPRALYRSTQAENPLHVIVVDDNRDAADSMAVLLELIGHHTEVAYDAHSALRLPGIAHADLIFLDIALPELDGYALAGLLRSRAKPEARFVALTGYGTEEGRQRSNTAGFHAHVVKPLTREALQALIESTLEAKARRAPSARP